MAGSAVPLNLVQVRTAYPDTVRAAFSFWASRFEGLLTLELGGRSYKDIPYALDTYSDLTTIPFGLLQRFRIPVPKPSPGQPRRVLDFAHDFAFSFAEIKNRRFATRGLILSSSKSMLRLALRDVEEHFAMTFEESPVRRLLLTPKAGPTSLAVHP